jgi:hypothetical protein
MNGRFAKFLIFILCGALILIAGCTTTAPSGGAAPTPAATTQVATTSPDLGTIVSLLRTISDKVSLVAENTQPITVSTMTGNIVLFDTSDSPSNSITYGSSVVALPGGTCDVVVFTDEVSMFATLEEMKGYTSRGINSRNKQTCLDVYACRSTVTLDSDFSYLFVTYKPYQSSNRLDRVTLSYRCSP